MNYPYQWNMPAVGPANPSANVLNMDWTNLIGQSMGNQPQGQNLTGYNPGQGFGPHDLLVGGGATPASTGGGGLDWLNQNAGAMRGIGNIMGGISNLGNMWTGWKGLGLAKDQFRFQQDAWNKNYANQLASYNRQVEDKATARKGFNPGFDAKGYVDEHRLG